MKTLIEVEHLRKTYGSTVAVDEVSFEVAEGEIFGLLGPNGAGKTTTVEIGGLEPPTSAMRMPRSPKLSYIPTWPSRPIIADEDEGRKTNGVGGEVADLPAHSNCGSSFVPSLA
jgi:energy-coupling factor transporter ATP-binding protein EcfA2